MIPLLVKGRALVDPSSFLGGHVSPTTTQLAEGYTDEILRSNYDNHRCSRPISQLSGTSLGSKVRLSYFSLTDDSMIGAGPRRSIADASAHHRASLAPKPTTTLGLLKYYYDKWYGRQFAPFLLLLFYAIMGAWMFYIVEHENEKILKVKEKTALEWLRNSVVKDMATHLRVNDFMEARKLLDKFEIELNRLKLPEALEWDMWGALFYVGTIFTTIGYGNIVPRTMLGRSLTVLYAIVGIPLVLAILSNTGRQLTELVGLWWRRYRPHIKKAKAKLSCAKDPEKGLVEEKILEKEKESSTIPVWLALLICIGWICLCAGLFQLWEERWNFFTSLYFFFISLSTIGLGDVVPDHPRLLIVMFILVIIGLSIVSMLLSVIQIKIEEWLYNLMIKLQEEAQQALNQHKNIGEGALLPKVMEKQGALTKIFAPLLMNERQTAEVEQKAQQFERIIRETNNKNMQTDPPVQLAMGIQAAAVHQSIACDPMIAAPAAHCETQVTPKVDLAGLRDISIDERDSVSDASSIPMDSVSVIERKSSDKLQRRVMFSDSIRKEAIDCDVQTDIAQFQIDEIMLRLFSLQKQNVRPSLVEKGIETSAWEESMKESFHQLTDKEILTEVLGVMSRSMETDRPIFNDSVEQGMNTAIPSTSTRGTGTLYPRVTDRATGASPAELISFDFSIENCPWDEEEKSQSSVSQLSVSRGRRDMNTSPLPLLKVDRAVEDDRRPLLVGISAETSLREELSKEDQATSPGGQQKLVAKTYGTQGSSEDRSLQTSLAESLKSRREKSQQTSAAEMLDEEMQTAERSGEDSCDDRMLSDGEMSRSALDGSFLNRPSPFKQRGRSSSTSGLGNSVYDEDLRQEVIIQTDDSYLKIARRLDEFRSNRTQGLSVCAAGPLSQSTDQTPPQQKVDRPSERRGFFLDGASFPLRKRSMTRNQRRKLSRMESIHRDSQATSTEDAPKISTRSSSLPARSQLNREFSLPAGVPRGKVFEYVSKHERGIPNPATERRKPVQIIRQYSVDDEHNKHS